MRSVSLLGAAWRCVCRWRESLSPGKVKELGRLAGEAGMELQKEPPFCRGLLGGKASLPKGEGNVVERGEFSGETAPGLVLPRGSGPRFPRASLVFPSWLVPEVLPRAFRGALHHLHLGNGFCLSLMTFGVSTQGEPAGLAKAGLEGQAVAGGRQ